MKTNLRREFLCSDSLRDYAWISIGAAIQALGMVIFMAPAHLISGGVSGIAQVIAYYTDFPIGLMTLLGNIPILCLGWRYLGRLRFAVRTVLAIALFSLFTDLFALLLSAPALTEDIFLNSIFGAVSMGIGFGLVYLGGGTSGGSDIIGRIFNQRMGIPITQSYLLTDTLSILLGAIAFGWELALYGLVALYVSGVAAEWISEGSSTFREAMIITSHPKEIGQKVIQELEHSVTYLNAVGGYTGEEKTIVYCVINRSEVNLLKRFVAELDSSAFMIVGQTNEVLGEGFQKYQSLD